MARQSCFVIFVVKWIIAMTKKMFDKYRCGTIMLCEYIIRICICQIIN